MSKQSPAKKLKLNLKTNTQRKDVGLLINNNYKRDLPGGPVVKVLHSQAEGVGSISPWLGS